MTQDDRRATYLAELLQLRASQLGATTAGGKNLEEMCSDQGLHVLPEPSGKDLSALVTYLDTELFDKGRLVKADPMMPDHDRFHPHQCLLQRAEMRQMGMDPDQYVSRDWTLAVEKMLIGRGCPPNMANFGQGFRVMWNTDRMDSILIMIADSVKNRCKLPPGSFAEKA